MILELGEERTQAQQRDRREGTPVVHGGGMSTTDLIDGVVGLSMYSTLLVITLAAFVWTGFRTGSCFRVSVQTVFHCFLFSFLCGTAHLPNLPPFDY